MKKIEPQIRKFYYHSLSLKQKVPYYILDDEIYFDFYNEELGLDKEYALEEYEKESLLKGGGKEVDENFWEIYNKLNPFKPGKVILHVYGDNLQILKVEEYGNIQNVKNIDYEIKVDFIVFSKPKITPPLRNYYFDLLIEGQIDVYIP